jgi:hypothetical protein
MVERHDNLLGVVDSSRADGHELERNRPRVVVRHALMWLQGDIVARLEHLALGDANGMALHNLLGEGLRGLGCFLEAGQEAGGRSLLQRMEHVRRLIARHRGREGARDESRPWQLWCDAERRQARPELHTMLESGFCWYNRPMAYSNVLSSACGSVAVQPAVTWPWRTVERCIVLLRDAPSPEIPPRQAKIPPRPTSGSSALVLLLLDHDRTCHGLT